MKFPKLIAAGVIFAALVLCLWLWRATDHRAEFRQALYSGNIGRVEELLQAHPSLANAKDMEGNNRGARGMPASGWRPLHIAAAMGNPEMVAVLVRHGAKVDARDNRGLTPLLWTAFAGQRDAAAALLSNGADINARDSAGRTTMDLAKLSLDNRLIELLRERGAKE